MKRFMKSFCVWGLTLLTLTLLSVHFASAHVKWFIDTDEVIASSHGVTPFYYLVSTEVIIWSLISILVVVLFSLFDRIIPEPKRIVDFSEKHHRGIVQGASIVLGIYLLSVTLLWKIILIPEFAINSPFTIWLGVIQIIAGTLFVFNTRVRVASALTMFLFVCMGIVAGPLAFFENALLLSLLLYFFIQYSPENSKWRYFKKASVEIVRVGAGVTLIVLAFTEKLMYPELGLNFLSIHDWNFMQHLGFTWFSDKLFVLSTGFAEMIFGVIFILGYLTRINTIAIAGFFAASVVTMFIQFGAWEVEDLVVYSAAVLFLFFGYGHTKFFHVVPQHSFWRRRHIGNFFKG